MSIITTPSNRGKKLSKFPRGVFEKTRGSKDYWIRFAGPNGNTIRQHVGRSLSAAKELVEQRRTEVRLGKFNPETVGRNRRPKMTVAKMFSHYLPLRVNVRNKGEDQRYADFWTNLFGTIPLDELSPADLDEWKADRLQQVKPSTVNRALEYLKAFYALAVRDGHADKNPVQRVQLVRENNERHRYLLESEERALKNALCEQNFDLVLFAIHSGLRQSEQFSARWEHVDQANKTLKIPLSKHGKHRFAQLNETCLEVLDRQRQRIAKLGLGYSDWVFPGQRKLTVHRDAHNFCREYFSPALAKAKIQDFTWHDLRHTFGSRLAQRGVPLYTIESLMGHSSQEMTKRYAHLAPSQLQGAVDQLHPSSEIGTPTDTVTSTKKSEPSGNSYKHKG